ncbi:hypothetical protein EUV02_06825 [Polymorphobacter arshaanensis]|uniref:Uncharacterized protein n=1 Tax=Glacieibacterium arshaanense TaxID=2511025 RepID=A0A4Y9ELL5_9SPHN|nr:hypothetical protein [Polymorphobacter arshaanensis]TFU02917.1 hypothetical protein EUV02_06825 [Polymorphobacter arshaanensis]
MALTDTAVRLAKAGAIDWKLADEKAPLISVYHNHSGLCLAPSHDGNDRTGAGCGMASIGLKGAKAVTGQLRRSRTDRHAICSTCIRRVLI